MLQTSQYYGDQRYFTSNSYSFNDVIKPDNSSNLLMIKPTVELSERYSSHPCSSSLNDNQQNTKSDGITAGKSTTQNTPNETVNFNFFNSGYRFCDVEPIKEEKISEHNENLKSNIETERQIQKPTSTSKRAPLPFGIETILGLEQA